jgi:hypothetical protein
MLPYLTWNVAAPRPKISREIGQGHGSMVKDLSKGSKALVGIVALCRSQESEGRRQKRGLATWTAAALHRGRALLH